MITDQPEKADESLDRRWLTSAAGIFLAGLVLMLLRLGDAPLSNDEAAYAYRVGSTWDHMFSVLSTDNYPLAYFIYLKVWARAFGISELALRLSSLPFAILTWIVFAKWSREVLPPRLALLALAFIVLSPFHLFLFRLAKYFSMLSFFSMVSLYLLWRLMHGASKDSPIREKKGEALILGLSVVGAAFTHYLGVVLGVCIGLWLLIDWTRTRSTRPLFIIGAMAVTGLLYIPQIMILFSRLAMEDSAGAEAVHGGILRRLAIQLGYMAYSYTVGHTLEMSHIILGGLGVLAAAVAILAGLFQRNRLTAYCAFFTFVPTILCFLIMWKFLPSLPDMDFGDRCSFVYPLVIVLAIQGAARLPLAGRWVLGTAWVIPAIAAIFHVYTLKENNRWEYLIPWGQIRADTPPGTLVADDFAFNSRIWYYYGDWPGEVVRLRNELATGSPESAARELLASQGPITILRATRDSTPNDYLTRLQLIIENQRGEPTSIMQYVQDSESMVRLKQRVRGDDGPATYPHKVELRIYNPSE